LREPIWAVRSADPRNAAILLDQTLRHHFANWLRLPRGGGNRFTVQLDLGGPEPSAVTLRRGAGDISILYEVFAEKAYGIADDQLPPESVAAVVDCGAHIGLTALYFAHRYPHARIIAVEPNPSNFAMLVANSVAEPRIFPLQACISDRSGTERIGTAGPGWGHTIDPKGVEVPALTLQDVRKRFDIDTIDLLKVDIEGAEEGVFASGIGKVRVVAAELHGDYTIECFARDVGPLKVKAQPGQDTVLAFMT
jgi:FkbM family methyltransferase